MRSMMIHSLLFFRDVDLGILVLLKTKGGYNEISKNSRGDDLEKQFLKGGGLGYR